MEEEIKTKSVNGASSWNEGLTSTDSGSDGEGGAGFLGILAIAAPIIASIVNAISSAKNAKEQREWNKEQADVAWNRSLQQWNMTNEYNTPDAQIQRERDAGLNPLYYGLNGESAKAFEAQQPLGYERAQGLQITNPFQNYQDAQVKQAQIDLANKQIDKLNSDIKNQDADTVGVELDNEFKRKTMNARVRGEELANELNEEQKKNIIKQRDLIAEEIRKTANEADNEFEKKSLIQAESRLRNATADEITTLLPYKQLNIEADTLSKKAAAAAATWSAMKDKKFVELGGVEQQIKECKARIDKIAQDQKTSEAQEQAAKAKAALDEWKNSVQQGTVFNYIIEDPRANAFERNLAGFFNGVFNVASMVTTTVGNILPKL